ncbi:MAG: hypothetical protein KDK25_08770 [Leptospiraceae bacterium]|nr:hypothetical protein [Leptospiraceae bacterium]MCB1170412.1 hypothetical protein [Leptospiraceae bacterium]
MAAGKSGLSGGAVLVGLFGLFLSFIAGLISFVIFMEYDPEGRLYLDEGVAVHATVFENQILQKRNHDLLEPELQAIITVKYTLEGREYRAISRPVSGAQIEFLRPGIETVGYILEERKERILLRESMPHAPRDLYDLIAPALFWLLGAICIVFAPDVLYFGTTEAPEGS